MRGAHREAEMVCASCNGKGYVVAKDREQVCNECQGRGEYLFVDRDRPQKQVFQETPEAR
jgi:DnaJ-class molecular chaperone